MRKPKRKRYTGAFKAKVGMEALKGIKTVGHFAGDYQAHPVQVTQWKGMIRDHLPKLFEPTRVRENFFSPAFIAAPSYQTRLMVAIGNDCKVSGGFAPSPSAWMDERQGASPTKEAKRYFVMHQDEESGRPPKQATKPLTGMRQDAASEPSRSSIIQIGDRIKQP